MQGASKFIENPKENKRWLTSSKRGSVDYLSYGNALKTVR
jgi:hypothetical protein